jgi:hypothetical protein
MLRDRKPRIASRVAYGIAFGVIESGKCVLHRCDNPACCNPTHLFLGTKADNTHDMISKGRARGAEGVKHHNHRLTEDQVRGIRAAIGPRRAIAERFGISPYHVSSIRLGRKWKHLQ